MGVWGGINMCGDGRDGGERRSWKNVGRGGEGREGKGGAGRT